MNDDSKARIPNGGARHQIVPSFSDLIVLVPARDEEQTLLVHQAPTWVAHWLGRTPAEIEGRPLREVFGSVMDGLTTVAEDVFREGLPVDEYAIEFEDRAGAPRAALLSAQRVPEYRLGPTSRARERVAEVGPAVLVRIQDITETMQARRRLQGIGVYHGILGRSRAMLQVFYKIEVYGPTDAPVVISGETGTGKELVARALHERSPRRAMPFVAVNCTALSEDLFESELFGHEKGAFTGAVRSHKGRFERADKGTLFLDEIGDMPPRTQAKLLRALELGTIERVGGEVEQPVNVRVLAATNISLEQAVAQRQFRADLYHRLSVFRIHAPPLRDRPGDLPLLVDHYLEMLNRRYGREGVRLTHDAMRLLGEYHWPGNVRELRNVLERVYVETRANVIGANAFTEWIRERDYLSAGSWNIEQLEHRRAWAPPLITPLPPGVGAPRDGETGEGPTRTGEGGGWPIADGTPRFPLARPAMPAAIEPPRTIDAVYSVVPGSVSRKPRELTEERIRRAFAQAGANATKAAAILGVHKATLYRRLKALGLTREALEGVGREAEGATDPAGTGPGR